VSTATIKAIETRYKGYRFRSRLEARWAVYFDAIGLKWEYEKEGFDLGGLLYLPDFWLPQVKMWGEVKAEEFTDEEIEKSGRLTVATGQEVLMLVGPPDCRSYWTVPLETGESQEPYSCEYVISSDRLSEHRFFSCPGFSEVMRPSDLEYWPDVVRAVNAARSARFEFGEQGGAS
jgi:hypothetical protein